MKFLLSIALLGVYTTQSVHLHHKNQVSSHFLAESAQPHGECIDEEKINKVYEHYDRDNNNEIDFKASLEAMFHITKKLGMTSYEESLDKYINELTIKKKYFSPDLSLSKPDFYRFVKDVVSHFKACNIKVR